MSKNAKIAIGIIVAVIIITIGYSILNTGPKETGLIKIGAILPMSGPYAKIGEDAQKAITLAFKETENVEIIFEDSQFDAKKAVSAYQKLISIDKVDALINLDSVSFAAIYPLIREQNLLTLQIAESNIHNKDTVFQIMPYSYPLFSKLGEVSDGRYEKVALIYGSGEFLVKNAEFFKKGIPANKIVYEAMLSSGSDYRTEVTKLLERKPEATTIFLATEDGVKFLKALQNQKGNKEIDLICDGNIEMSIAQYIEAVGEEIFDGCVSTNLPSQMTNAFKGKFKQEYGIDAGFFSDYAYDSALILKMITREPKASWAKTVKSLSLDGASGKIKFDENGTRLPASEVHIFRNGKFEKI